CRQGRAGSSKCLDLGSQVGDGLRALPVSYLAELIGQRAVKRAELLLGVLLSAEKVGQRRAPGGHTGAARRQRPVHRAAAGDVGQTKGLRGRVQIALALQRSSRDVRQDADVSADEVDEPLVGRARSRRVFIYLGLAG